MRKRLLLLLVVAVLFVGCGNAESTSKEKDDHTEKQTETQTEETSHTHNYVEEITTEATCEAEGVKTLVCECGDSYTETILAKGHIYENYVSNGDATYLADGTETAVCSGCELTDTRVAEGSKLVYTYTELNKTMYAKQSVNVRDLPAVEGNLLGGLSYAQEIKVLGQCTETNWYKIEFSGGVGYVSNDYVVDNRPVQETQAPSQSSGSSGNQTDSLPGNVYILDGMQLEYGVMYVNVCGHNLTGERILTKSEGPFPYPLGELIDNGDGTYTVYEIFSHGYILDGQFYVHDTSPTRNIWFTLMEQGYSVTYAGGDSWHACVGGYDEGCIKKLIVTPQ